MCFAIAMSPVRRYSLRSHSTEVDYNSFSHVLIAYPSIAHPMTQSPIIGIVLSFVCPSAPEGTLAPTTVLCNQGRLLMRCDASDLDQNQRESGAAGMLRGAAAMSLLAAACRRSAFSLVSCSIVQ